MSKATQALRDFLTASPSVVFPDEVLELLGPVEDENTKMREELAKWERLAAGIDLPEYPVTQFEPKDLERENVTLRKLVEEMYPVAKAYTTIAKQLGCVDDVTYEWEMRMLKLGIKVN